MFKWAVLLFLCFAQHALASNRGIIIDTDAGMDDSMAMAYILSHKGISVKAITIDADALATCRAGYNNTKAIISAFHYPKIPVACGQSFPIEGNNRYPQFIIDGCDQNAAIGFKISQLKPKKNAVSLLYKTIMHSTDSLDILAIGPLTNLAQLFEQYPEVKKNIHRLFIMGGAVHVRGNVIDADPGNINKYAEYNFYIDPTAAHNVIASGVPITLVPLDLSNSVPLDTKVYNLFKLRKNTLANQFILRIMSANSKFLQANKWYFWDPMAAALIEYPALAHCQKNKIRVLPSGSKREEGRVIVDYTHGAEVTVCDRLYDKEKFYYVLSR